MSEVTREIFNPGTPDSTSFELSQHLPQGKVWQAKAVAGTNLNAIVGATAFPHYLMKQSAQELADEFDANNTTLLIDEWERSVGLPDNCLGQATTIQERRERVIQRLRKSPIVTLSELQELVNSFLDGVTVTLTPGQIYYSLPYQLPQQLLGNVNARFILVAEIERQGSELPYALPQQLIRGIDDTLIRCLLEKVIPANVYLNIVTRL